MDPVTGMALATALTGLLGAGAAGASNDLAYAQLAESRRRAAEEERIATAGRTDAYGNRQRYNPATNTWETDLTPTQEEIVRAGETEQRRNLLEDAPRNRAIREALARYGKDAQGDYDKAYSDYKYGGPRSEDAIRGDLEDLYASQAVDRGRQGAAPLTAQLLRSRRGALLPNALRVTDNNLGANLTDIILNARKGAQSEYAQRAGQHEQLQGGRLNNIISRASLGGDVPVSFSGAPERLAGEQGKMSSDLLSALNSIMSNSNSAGFNASKIVGNNKLDLKSIASLADTLTGNRKNSSLVQKQYTDPYGYSATDSGSSSFTPDWDSIMNSAQEYNVAF